MKIKQILSFMALGLLAINGTGLAQNTSGSTTQSAGSGTTQSTSGNSATPAAGQYQQSSAANGTAVNNSNSTNYNSNNVTNAPTGVGSNPSVSTAPTTLQGTSSANPSAGQGSNPSSATGGTPKTGTAAAVTGAPKAPTPAVVAGSTERNTSLHDFIASSPNYITLQNALQSTDLDGTLKASGPYTLFAPSNTAFKKLPASVQSSLLEGRNRSELKQLLSYHLLKGLIDTAELTKQIKASGGKAQLRTLAGGILVAQLDSSGHLALTDEQGKSSVIDAPDNRQSNGVVHGIDAVLLPKNAGNGIR